MWLDEVLGYGDDNIEDYSTALYGIWALYFQP